MLWSGIPRPFILWSQYLLGWIQSYFNYYTLDIFVDSGNIRRRYVGLSILELWETGYPKNTKTASWPMPVNTQSTAPKWRIDMGLFPVYMGWYQKRRVEEKMSVSTMFLLLLLMIWYDTLYFISHLKLTLIYLSC